MTIPELVGILINKGQKVSKYWDIVNLNKYVLSRVVCCGRTKTNCIHTLVLPAELNVSISCHLFTVFLTVVHGVCTMFPKLSGVCRSRKNLINICILQATDV